MGNRPQQTQGGILQPTMKTQPQVPSIISPQKAPTQAPMSGFQQPPTPDDIRGMSRQDILKYKGEQNTLKVWQRNVGQHKQALREQGRFNPNPETRTPRYLQNKAIEQFGEEPSTTFDPRKVWFG